MGVSKDNSRKVHIKRWQHVRVIHIILPFPGIQSFFARHLKCPHYHLSKKEQSAWLGCQAKLGIEVRYYSSKLGVQESPFLQVFNHSDESQ